MAPSHAGQYNDEIEAALRDAVGQKAVVAVGSCGLNALADDVQQGAFERQVALALDAGLPLIVEARGAYDRAIECLKEWEVPPDCVALRAQDASFDELATWATWGAYIVFDGLATDDPAGYSAFVDSMPANRVLVASGAPEAGVAMLAGCKPRADQVVFVVSSIASHMASIQLVENAKSFFSRRG